MISALVPKGVIVAEASEEKWGQAIDVREASQVAGAVERRRREFAAGRSCARSALAQLGIENFPLLMNKDRTPRWPPGIVGSITHATGYCASAVASESSFRGIGIDVETSQPMMAELIHHICCPSEIKRLRRFAMDRMLAYWATVVFSAKESVYKCHYSVARRILEFRDVEIEFLPDSGAFTAFVRETPHFSSTRRVLHGRFADNGKHVFTCATLPFA